MAQVAADRACPHINLLQTCRRSRLLGCSSRVLPLHVCESCYPSLHCPQMPLTTSVSGRRAKRSTRTSATAACGTLVLFPESQLRPLALSVFLCNLPSCACQDRVAAARSHEYQPPPLSPEEDPSQHPSGFTSSGWDKYYFFSDPANCSGPGKGSLANIWQCFLFLRAC